MQFRMWAATVCAILTMSLAACGEDANDSGASSTGGQASEPEVTVGVVLPSLEFPFYRDVKAGAEAEANGMAGVTLELETSSGTFTPQKYLDAIDTVASSGVDALGLDPYDAELFMPVMKRISAEGTPVVNASGTSIEGSGETSVIATDTESAVRAGMESMVDLMGGSGKVGLILFPGNGVVSKRIEYARRFIPEFGAEVTAEAPLTAECLAVPAANATQDLLQANPDLDGLFVPCGDPAIGAARAAAQAGRDDLTVFSYDGTPAEVKAIKEGRLTGSIAQQPKEIGATMVRVLTDIARGKEVEPLYEAEFEIVTKENVDSFIAE